MRRAFVIWIAVRCAAPVASLTDVLEWNFELLFLNVRNDLFEQVDSRSNLCGNDVW